MTRTLVELVANAAEHHAESAAIVMGDERLTYSDLEAMSSRIANVLREHGCSPGERVCLLLPKSPMTIAGLIGILKAGCAYVPIDIRSPAARTAHIVESTEPALVLASSETTELLEGIAATGALSPATLVGSADDDQLPSDRITTAFTREDIAAAAEEPPRNTARSESPAQILFTSGSTGIPKGVVISHHNALSFIEWAIDYFGIAAGERISGHTPLHFDLSTLDIFGSLGAGAELHPVPHAVNLLPSAMAQFIEARRLHQWFSVPSAMTFLAKGGAFPDQGFPSLRRVIWCGEVLPTPVLTEWMRRVPHASFTNLYGPTEATVASSYHTVGAPPDDETASIPIGVACPGEELVVLDSDLAEVPPGETGDLYLGGVGLSSGYWRDDERTREAFIADPRDPAGRLYRTGDLARFEDGVFWFLGRSDTQVKIRGYRIELGEIETALNAVPGIAEAAVVAVRSSGFDSLSLCGAYASRSDRVVTLGTVRDTIRTVLPPYMIPTRWLELSELPKNSNGKVDRPALRAMFDADPAHDTPAEAERQRPT